MAYVGIWVFVTLAPGFYPPSQDITIRPAVLLFTFAVSVSTGILAGVFPALRVSRPDLQEALKQSARGGGSGIRQGLRRALVVIEVAMALVLLVGAGLMINSYARVMRVDMGFRPDPLLTMEINLSGLARYRTRHNASHFSVTPQVSEFYREVMERVRALPGVRSVGVTSGLPPGESMTTPFRIVGQAGDFSDNSRVAQYYETSAQFFETMGIPLLRGRAFTEADGEKASPVAVINEALAKQYFGDTDPLGQIIEARINQGNPDLADDRPREIVGVVADTRMRQRDEPEPMIYVPYQQHLWDYAGTGPFYIDARKDFAIRTELSDPTVDCQGRSPARRRGGPDGRRRQRGSDARAALRFGRERAFLVAPARALRRARRVSRDRRHLRRDRLRAWNNAPTSSASGRRSAPGGGTSCCSSCAKASSSPGSGY